MIYCLDTDICIYFLKGKYPALLTRMLLVNPNDIKIPSIVKAELLHGAKKSVRHSENTLMINTFLMPFEIVPFDDAATVHYANVKATLEQRGLLIEPNDLLIAAISLAVNATLVTNNEKEYNRVDGLNLENWTTPL